MAKTLSSARSALAVTLAIQVVTSIAVLAVPVMAPAMAASLRVSPTLIGAYVATLYIGSMFASLLAGPLVLRYGPIRVSQLGLLSAAIGLVAMALADGLAWTVVGALLVGIGNGPITPASSHLLTRTTPPHRMSLVFSIKQSGVPVGGVLAGVFVPALVLTGGTTLALLALAAANFACALIAQPIRAGLDSDRQPDLAIRVTGLLAPIRLVASHDELRRLTSFAVVFSLVQVCLATYLVTYLHSALGYSLLAAGAAMSATQLGGVMGRVAWGYIADRWLGARRMLATLAIAMAICCVVVATLQAGVRLPLVFTLMIVFGASATGWNGVVLAELARLAPVGQSGAATGGTIAILLLGVVLGPVLFGALSGVFDSYRAAFTALAFPAAFCGWRLFRMACAESRSAAP